MKRILKRIVGSDRPKIVAVIGITREDVNAGIGHARTGAGGLPVWAWCAEPSEPVPDCERFVSSADANRVRRDLRDVWPALVVVAWTGSRGDSGLKLLPLVTIPFRAVAFNEAGGFFAITPASALNHAFRRARDGAKSAARRAVDHIRGAANWVRFFVPRTADRLWSFTLALLGFLAQCTPPLARFAARRLNRRTPHPIEPLDLGRTGETYSEIAVPNRGWPARAIREALENSQADYLVLRRRGEQAVAEPLIALARATHAFAVALQTGWSGWPETVARRFPFRRLQPEEITRVDAPYSSLLVIRRDLLRRCGIPGAMTFGAGLLMLFRKAAGLGAVNYVCGSPLETGQEPAMALEDAEYVLRLGLSQFAPAINALARGNIAWSPGDRRPFRGLPRVLVVSPYLPFPLSHGGAVRIYSLCRALSDRMDFVLACFREAGETVYYSELHRVFREVYVVDIDEKHRDPTVPDQISGYRNSAMADLTRGLCAEGSIDLVQLEYTQMAEYRQHTAGVPSILVEHDITFTLHRQLAEAFPGAAAQKQYELWLRFERETLSQANYVWTMSESDRALAIEHGAHPQTTEVVPNGVDLERFRAEPRPGGGSDILFVGSFRHRPNLLAFEALRDRIMPMVWNACPEARLHVVAGADQPRPADPRIEILGFVGNIEAVYRKCDVVVIPLPLSAGTNIKLMEAMACGKPVVSTPVGCHGLGLTDGEDLLIRDLGPEFGDAMILLLKDETLRLRLGRKARRTAEQRFDWNAIARRALDMMLTPHETLCARTHSDRPDAHSSGASQ